jgi:hypothetical protein
VPVVTRKVWASIVSTEIEDSDCSESERTVLSPGKAK